MKDYAAPRHLGASGDTVFHDSGTGQIVDVLQCALFEAGWTGRGNSAGGPDVSRGPGLEDTEIRLYLKAHFPQLSALISGFLISRGDLPTEDPKPGAR